MFAELATYIAPRRKAVELTGANGSLIETKVTLDYDALSATGCGRWMALILQKVLLSGRGKSPDEQYDISWFQQDSQTWRTFTAWA